MSNDDTGLNSSVADAAAGVGSEPQGTATETTEGQDNNGIHPAWNELIEKLPTQFVPTVTPILQQWDKGVQDRFQKVQSTYAPYKPFIEGGVTPDQIDAAMRLMQAVEADPKSFYEKMGQFYAQEWGLDQGQGSDDADEYSLDDLDDDEGQGPVDLENNPYVQQIKQQQDLLTQFVAGQYEQQQKAAMAQAQEQANKEIETELAQITEKHGEMSKEAAEIVFGMAMQNEGMTLVQAADRFFAIAGNSQPRQQAVIMSPGGGLPASNVNPAELNGQDRRNLVAQILQQAAEANKQ